MRAGEHFPALFCRKPASVNLEGIDGTRTAAHCRVMACANYFFFGYFTDVTRTGAVAG